MKQKEFWIITFSSLIALIGAVVITYSTELGPWTMVDTVDYFDVAHNLYNGFGLVNTSPSGFSPMTIHPPLYSILLTLGLIINVQLLDFARIVNIILFIILALIIILGTYRHTSSVSLSVILGVWIISNRAIFRNYTAALSEPLFLTLGIASLYLVIEYTVSNKSWLIFTSALLAGLSLATRYSGAAFIAAGFLTIFIWKNNTWVKTIKDLLVYTVVSITPMFLWIAYLRISFPGSTPGSYEKAEDIWKTMMPFRTTYIDGIWNWLGLNLLSDTLRYRSQLAIIAIIFFTIVVAGILSLRVSRYEHKNLRTEPIILLGSTWGIFSIASTAILLFSYIFVYAPKPWLDERLYSPIHIGTVLTILYSLYYCLSKLTRKPYQNFILLIFSALIISANIPRYLHTATKLHRVGEGYTSKSWDDKMLVDALQEIPADKKIISNDPGAIFFFLGRTSIDLIPILEHTKTNEVPSVFYERGVYIVLFERRLASQIGERYEESTQQYIQKITEGLKIKHRGSIGNIYFTE